MAALDVDVNALDYDSETDNMSVSSVPMSTTSSNPDHAASADDSNRSMRSGSPCSIWSMTSSMREASLREEFGRQLNTYSDVYRLPADEEELTRLDKQHLLFIEAMGGKYCPAMAELMEVDYHTTGRRKTVLDLGCGSGSWITDVARDFPACEAVGVDLVPMQIVSMPPNCRSEVDDINLGMEHYYEYFDVAHTRLVASGVNHYNSLIREIGRMLRPGGLIDITEWDFGVYDENFQKVVCNTDTLGAPWWPRWLAFAAEAIRSYGGDVDAAPNLYDNVLKDGTFQEVCYRDFWISSCPWTTDNPFQQKLGAAMSEDILSFMNSGRPLLLGKGYDKEVVDTLQEQASRELKTAKSRTWVRLQCVTGRRKDFKTRHQPE